MGILLAFIYLSSYITSQILTSAFSYVFKSGAQLSEILHFICSHERAPCPILRPATPSTPQPTPQGLGAAAAAGVGVGSWPLPFPALTAPATAWGAAAPTASSPARAPSLLPKRTWQRKGPLLPSPEKTVGYLSILQSNQNVSRIYNCNWKWLAITQCDNQKGWIQERIRSV